MPPTPDKMERARRDKRFKLAQKELEPMFSEMINKFMAEKDGQTSIHLETLVDPKGGLPTWVVDKAGKSAAVKIVRALIKYTTDRYRAHTGGSKGSSTKGRTAQPEMPIAGGASSGDSEMGTSFFSAMLSRWNIFA